jgi:hypothetical protein
MPASGPMPRPPCGPGPGLSPDPAARPPSAAERLRRAGHLTLLECGPAAHTPVTVGDVPGLLAALRALQRPAHSPPQA